MVEHFFGQRALVVEHDGTASETAEHPADERPLMQMAVDDVRAEQQELAGRLDEQRHVEVRLVARAADLGPLEPRHVDRAVDIDARQVAAVVIGAEADPVAEALERGDLFEDTDMTAVVREEGRRRDHQDA